MPLADRADQPALLRHAEDDIPLGEWKKGVRLPRRLRAPQETGGDPKGGLVSPSPSQPAQHIVHAMRKSFATFLKATALVILALGGCCYLLSRIPPLPKNYFEKVRTGGEIEAKYLAMGPHGVERLETATFSSLRKFVVHYPRDIEAMGKAPVVIFLNGTGTPASKYPALQRHMASWGFIVIGNEEDHAFYGEAVELSIRYLLLADAYGSGNEASPLKGHVDFDHMGVTGHSQGGVGVINGITIHPNSHRIKAAVMSCATDTDLAKALLWDCDASLIRADTMMLTSTGPVDASIAPLDSMRKTYDSISEEVTKVLARRKDCDHGEMLYSADGYVTAWFMWRLQGDQEAARAFSGTDPELFRNPLYQDQMGNQP